MFGPEGLGGLGKLVGSVQLDRQLTQGTIRLRGSGSDALGGSLASASFDLRGTVGLIVK